MKTFASVIALGICCLHAESKPDTLRFENGDQLSGRFTGFTVDGSILMESADLKQPAEFRTGSVRHLVLRGGEQQAAEESLSHLGLTNGDRIPGRIIDIDDTHITIESKFADTLRIPKSHVSLVATNPLGGRVHYFGPFAADGWNILRVKTAEAGGTTKADEPWEFSAGAWFWKGKRESRSTAHMAALARADGMSDRSVLRFRMDWKDRLALSIAFHADFTTGPADPQGNDPRRVPDLETNSPTTAIFGNCYVLQIHSSHMMLYRSVWNPDTGPRFDRIQINSSYMRLNEDRSALIEIRSNRNTGYISLFINDEFVSQWTEPTGTGNDDEGYAGKGNGFGFLCHQGGTALRISEVMVCDWNGMPDSARSMELDDKDAILLTNGTDRFAGKILGFGENRSIRFETRHGTIQIPIDEISEIRLARSGLAKSEPDDSPVLHLGPIGRYTARSISGDRNLLKLQHPILGPIELKSDPVIMIEYKPGTRIIDDWDADL